MAAPWEKYQQQEAPSEAPAEAAPEAPTEETAPVEAAPAPTVEAAPETAGPWTKYQTKEAPPVQERTEPVAEAPVDTEEAWKKSAQEHPYLGRAAAALEGAGSYIPFRKDISAGLHALTDFGEGSFGEKFSRAKNAQTRAQKALESAYPGAYFAGNVAPMFIPGVGEGLAGAEGALAAGASKLPLLSKAPQLAGAVGLNAAMGAAQGIGEGEGSERLKNAAMAAGVGGLGGGLMHGAGQAFNAVMGPATKTATQEAAERLGIKAPRFITSESPTQQQLAATVKETPLGLGSAIDKSYEKLHEDLGTKLLDVAGAHGANEKTAGESIRQGVRGWVGPRTKGVLSKAYQAVEQHIDPSVQTPLSNLQTTFKKMQDENVRAGLAKTSPTMKIVEEAQKRQNGLTYEGINKLRKTLGEKYKAAYKDPTISSTELDRLYGALKEDQGLAIKRADISGSGRATRTFERANTLAQNIKDKRAYLQKITGVSETSKSDEAIYNQLANMAKGKTGDEKRIAAARSVMSPAEWRDVTGAVVNNLGRGSDNAFSPERFITEYGKLSDAGKNALFGPASNPLRQNLEDITTIARTVKQSGKYINRSKTAHVLNSLNMLGNIGKWGGAAIGGLGVEEAARGKPEGLGTEIGGALLLSSLLSSPRGSGAILNYMRNATPMAAQGLLNEARVQAGMSNPDRENRASGGKVDKRDYPAKRLTRMERALKRAQDALAEETKPIMQMPDSHVAHALEIAKDK
jgi:hypothetical protein